MPIHYTPDFTTALAAFDPRRFGFVRRADTPNEAWVKTIPSIGNVYFTMLSWEHGNQYIHWNSTPLSILECLVEMQMAVWGMIPKDTQSPLDMAIIRDTGGYIGVAYQEELGFSAEGWLGFVVGLGGSRGVLASHMLGVNVQKRSTGIGWHLKMLQAYEALKTGHHTIEWTVDPMRSHNAKLNIAKLGAFAVEYIINKYGEFRSDLYGRVPSDRLVMRWELVMPKSVTEYPTDASFVIPENVSEMARILPEYLHYEIPADIGELTAIDPHRAQAWRQATRFVLTQLMDTKQPHYVSETLGDPALMTVRKHQGAYQIVGFTHHENRSFYLLKRKDTTHDH